MTQFEELVLQLLSSSLDCQLRILQITSDQTGNEVVRTETRQIRQLAEEISANVTKAIAKSVD